MSTTAIAISVITVIVLVAGCASGAAFALSREGRAITQAVLMQIRWWMFPLALATLAAIVVTGNVLALVPPLDWGWWEAVGNASPSPETVYVSNHALLPIAFVINLCVLAAAPYVGWVYEVVFRASRCAEQASWPKRLGWCLLGGAPLVIFGSGINVALAFGLCLGVVCTILYLRAYREVETSIRTSQATSYIGAVAIEWRNRSNIYQHEAARIAAFASAAFMTVFLWLGTALAAAIAIGVTSGLIHTI